MNCNEAIKLMDGGLDNELDLLTQISLDDHVHQCPSCAARYSRRKVISTLVKHTMQVAPVPETLRSRVYRTLGVEPEKNRPPRRLIPAAAGVLLVSIFALVAWPMLSPLVSSLHERFIGGDKFVYHVTDSDNADTALQNIMFHLKAVPDAHVVLVTHNRGVDFLLKGAKDANGALFEPKVAALAARGVKFEVCNNTLHERGIPTSRVITEARLVPSGIAEVGRLEEDGYAYLKP